MPQSAIDWSGLPDDIDLSGLPDKAPPTQGGALVSAPTDSSWLDKIKGYLGAPDSSQLQNYGVSTEAPEDAFYNLPQEQRDKYDTYAQNAVGELGKAAVGIPEFLATKLPEYAYKGLKIASGNESLPQAASDVLGEAVPMGEYLAHGINAPVGSREFDAAAIQLLMMASPALEGIKGVPKEVAPKAPPVQVEAPTIQTPVEPSISPELGELPPIEPESITLYHSSPKKFDAFTGTGTETGLGGRAFYFSDKPEPAYGENVVSVNVPTDKILNLNDTEGNEALNTDSKIRKAGYEGTFNEETDEYTLYDPNQFLKPPESPQPAAAPEPPPVQENAASAATGAPSVPTAPDLGTGLTATDASAEPLVGAHHEALSNLYGDVIERGEGLGPQAMVDQGRSDLQNGNIDPYQVASKVTNGEVTSPAENGVLIAEHERLADAAIRAGRVAEDRPTAANSSQYEALRQQAEDFAVNVLKPAATKAGDNLRVWQAVSPPDLTTELGMREAMRLNADRELSANEISEAKRMAKEGQRADTMATDSERNLYRQLDKTTKKSSRIPTRDEIGKLFSDLAQKVCD